MSKKILTTPIKEEDVKDLKIGDIVYLTGTLVTARDCAHTRVVKHGRKLPGTSVTAPFPRRSHHDAGSDEPERLACGRNRPHDFMRMELFEKGIYR